MHSLARGFSIVCDHGAFTQENCLNGINYLERHFGNPRFYEALIHCEHSPFLQDCLTKQRPCNVPNGMGVQLSRCKRSKGETFCQTNAQHLLFICLIAYELENLWNSLSILAHQAAPQIKDLNTLYLHPEIYKLAMEPFKDDWRFVIERLIQL